MIIFIITQSESDFSDIYNSIGAVRNKLKITKACELTLKSPVTKKKIKKTVKLVGILYKIIDGEMDTIFRTTQRLENRHRGKQ